MIRTVAKAYLYMLVIAQYFREKFRNAHVLQYHSQSLGIIGTYMYLPIDYVVYLNVHNSFLRNYHLIL